MSTCTPLCFVSRILVQERGVSMYELYEGHRDIVSFLQLCPWPERRISIEAGGLRYGGL